jgi:hypothetical protein
MKRAKRFKQLDEFMLDTPLDDLTPDQRDSRARIISANGQPTRQVRVLIDGVEIGIADVVFTDVSIQEGLSNFVAVMREHYREAIAECRASGCRQKHKITCELVEEA